MAVDVLDNLPDFPDIIWICLIVVYIFPLDPRISRFVNVECLRVERGETAAYICLLEAFAGIRKVRDGAESTIALPENAPRLARAGYQMADIFSVFYDRVCPEMGKILGLPLAVSSQDKCLAIGRSGPARPALIQQDNLIFLQCYAEPPVNSYGAICLYSRAALQKEEISGLVPVGARYNLTCVQCYLFAVRIGIIERDRKKMIPRGCRRASGKKVHVRMVTPSQAVYQRDWPAPAGRGQRNGEGRGFLQKLNSQGDGIGGHAVTAPAG